MITLSTASLYPYSLSRIFEMAASANFKGVELMLRSQKDNAYLDSWDIGYLKKLEKEYNLKINSVHVPFSFNDQPQNFHKILKLSTKLKTKFIIIHLPRQDEIGYQVWFYSFPFSLYPNVLVENIHYKKNYANPIIGYDSLFNIQNMCFDIAHALRSINQHEVEQLMSKLKNIRQFHVSWWDGKEDHLSIVKNTSFFQKILKNRKEDLCLELCPKAFKNLKEKTIIEELKKNRRIIENAYNLEENKDKIIEEIKENRHQETIDKVVEILETIADKYDQDDMMKYEAIVDTIEKVKSIYQRR